MLLEAILDVISSIICTKLTVRPWCYLQSMLGKCFYPPHVPQCLQKLLPRFLVLFSLVHTTREPEKPVRNIN